MKNYFLLLLLVLALHSCKNEDENLEPAIEKTTIVAGKVSVPDSVVLESLTVYLYNYQATDYREFSGMLSADGDFRIEVPMTQGAELTLLANSPINFIALPGDSIHIAFEANAQSALPDNKFKFTGDRITVNERLQEYKAKFPLNVQPFYDSQEEDVMEEFLDYVNAQQKTLAAYNENFIQKADEQVLIDYIEAQEKYYLPSTRLDFANYRSYFGFESPDADGDYYKFLKELPELKSKDLVNTGTVQRLIYNLTYHLRSQARAEAGEGMDDDAMDAKALEIATSKKSKGLLYDYVIHDLVYASLNDHNISVYEKSKELIQKSVKNQEILTSIEKKYEAEKALLKSPVIPEEAELLTFESENPENYLEEIIANANGKVIYIDNWATWCGPCKVEFKEASPKLYEKFKDKVEFVYFCHNSERRTYIPSIAQFNIKGKHYFLEDAASETVARQINLEGFPTYTIFNKKGELVLSDYIHRPSYPETTELLTTLVNE